MSTSPQLALAYIARSPVSAGRVLSSMPAETAAAFLESIPVAHAAKLIANLPPPTAARIVQEVKDKTAAGIFRDLDFGKASAVVRQMKGTEREQFLQKLSRRTRAALQKSLSFSRGTVGAHMPTAIATLAGTDSVAAALDIIRQSDRDYVDAVFVLDEARSLVGVVTSAVALRNPESTRLATIVDTSCPVVSAHSRLDAVSGPEIWQEFSHLPVVNRQREVIGAISRTALNSALLAGPTETSFVEHSIPAAMFSALAATATGLLDLLSASLSAVAGRGERNGR